MVEHNTELEIEAKKYLPDGHALTTDRFFDAKKQTKDINKWAEDTRRMDLVSFDTKAAREKSTRKAVKNITGRTSGEQVLMAEPERFVSSTYEAGRLLAKQKKKIIDKETFISAIKNAWGQDGSLQNLLGGISKEDEDEVFENMFNESIVQNWIKENIGLVVIMDKQNVGVGRAESIWKLLTTIQREKLVEKGIQSYETKRFSQLKTVVEQSLVPSKQPYIPSSTVSQKSYKGTPYERRKPMRYNEVEIEFLKNYGDYPLAKLVKLYRLTFTKTYRTPSSLYNKRYRLSK